MVTYRCVQPSIAFSIGLSVIEVAITLALSFWIFGRNGISSHDVSLGFTLEGIPGDSAVHGLFLGLVFSVLSYTGFESTAPLAEETRDPKRNVARAALIGVALILVYYVIFGFATAIGFGIDNVAADFPGATNPYFQIAEDVWGSAGTIIVLIALINSGWGCSLAVQSAAVRGYYKMAKIGVFPSAVGRLHPTHRPPHIPLAPPPASTARRAVRACHPRGPSAVRRGWRGTGTAPERVSPRDGPIPTTVLGPQLATRAPRPIPAPSTAAENARARSSRSANVRRSVAVTTASRSGVAAAAARRTAGMVAIRSLRLKARCLASAWLRGYDRRSSNVNERKGA